MLKVYVAQRMTGQYCDEMVTEALKASRALANFGFHALSPVLNEAISNKHELLPDTSLEDLRKHWQKDKRLLQDAHIVLDLNGLGKSDGVNTELGYARFFLWKPVIRIHPKAGMLISTLEHDVVVASLSDALLFMRETWGTKRQLLWWRLKVLNRSLLKFVTLQVKFLGACL